SLDSRPTVLVVDDEDVVRSLAATVLERNGFRVLLAEDGARGIDLFTTRPDGISAVLLDLTMPKVNGQETLSRLRAIRPGVRVLASSGFSAIEAQARFGGVLDGFLQKPYPARQLVAAIRAVVETPQEAILEKSIQSRQTSA